MFQIRNSSDFYFRFNQSITLERLEILDRILFDNDLCRVIDIPAHIPIKILSNNLCSCSVFYLYRRLRHTLSPLALKELTPTCYFKMSLDEIEREEHHCSFSRRIHECHQMQGKVKIYIPGEMCHRISKLVDHNRSNSSSYFSVIFILTCLLIGFMCIYILSTHRRQLFISNIFNKFSFHCHCRHVLPIFTADSYQQLPHTNDNILDDDINRREMSTKKMKVIVKYNSTTEQIQPYLYKNKSNLISSDDTNNQINEDIILKLNTNSLSDIEHNQ